MRRNAGASRIAESFKSELPSLIGCSRHLERPRRRADGMKAREKSKGEGETPSTPINVLSPRPPLTPKKKNRNPHQTPSSDSLRCFARAAGAVAAHAAQWTDDAS